MHTHEARSSPLLSAPFANIAINHTVIPADSGLQKMTGPLLSVSEVANAFDEIVRNEKYSGSILSISQELGIAQHYVTPMSDQAKKTIEVIVPRTENQKLAAKL